MMAIVAESRLGRVYLPPIESHEAIATSATSQSPLDALLPQNPRDFKTPNYGLGTFGDLFTRRQLNALETFSALVSEVRDQIFRDAVAAGYAGDGIGLEAGGDGATAYSEAVSIYLALGVSRLADIQNSLCGWEVSKTQVRHLFTKQAIPMVWDFGENNAFGAAAGGYGVSLKSIVKVVERFGASTGGRAWQAAAQKSSELPRRYFSTDPPYYDNIGYADLSDFFYQWIRKALQPVFPKLFATMAVPKQEELVATPYRHGGKEQAERFFLEGMSLAMGELAARAHPGAPVTIYYAFKQSETKRTGTHSAGWETFLAAVLKSGFVLTGTWPIRTELGNRMIGAGKNALASSIILVCRPRTKDVGTISRRQFVRMLNESLPAALDAMIRSDEGEHSPVAPVDLSQAIIGPGMAIFSRYDAVLEADGSPMSVKTALQLINRFLAEDDFDADTQFCLSWFEQHGWDAGKFGEADTLARAKGTSVDDVKQAGVAEAGGGSVRLLRWKEYAADWDPSSDVRLPVWEALHQLIRAYNTKGDAGAAKVLAQTASKAEAMRQLAYRLYTVCERKGRADDARAYNEVVTGWTGIETAASKESATVQGQLFEN
jgi:putative DNA methylase